MVYSWHMKSSLEMKAVKKIKKTISLTKESYNLITETRKKYVLGNAPAADILQTLSQVDHIIPTISGIFERALNLFHHQFTQSKDKNKLLTTKEPIFKTQTIYLTAVANKKYNELIVKLDCKPIDLINSIINIIYA